MHSSNIKDIEDLITIYIFLNLAFPQSNILVDVVCYNWSDIKIKSNTH